MSNPITVLDIKNALKDDNFRNSLPEELKPDIEKFMGNQNCSCNMKVYQRVMQLAEKQVRDYFPDKTFVAPDQMAQQAAQQPQMPEIRNNFSVINCSIGELEAKLQSLKGGRKQISMARFEDQVTVIINDLDIIQG